MLVACNQHKLVNICESTQQAAVLGWAELGYAVLCCAVAH